MMKYFISCIFLISGMFGWLRADVNIPPEVSRNYDKARHLLYLNEDSSFYYSEQVYDWAVRNHATTLEASVLLLKAESLLYRGDVESVMGICTTVRRISQQSANRSILAESEILKGRAYLEMDMYDKAYSSFLNAKYFSDELRDTALSARVYNSFGVLADLQDEYDKALSYYRMAMKMAEETGDTLLQVRIKNNVALIYTRQGRFSEAMAALHECIGYVEEYHLALGLDRVYMNLAPLYAVSGQIDSSLYFIDRSLAISRFNRNRSSESRALIYKGYIWFSQELYDSAYHAFSEADKIAIEDGFSNLHAMILQYQSWIAEKKGDFEQAYHLLSRYKRISDSLEDNRNIANLVRLEYENDLSREEILGKYRNYRMWVSVISGSFLLLILVFFMLRYIGKQRKRLVHVENDNHKLSSVLEMENKKNVTQSLYNQKKTGELLAVIDSLAEVVKEYKLKGAVADSLNTISERIAAYLHDEDWGDFEARFERVHQSFFRNLATKYPELTLAERRLCAYLRLDMSTKEIAELTHVSVRSVEQARYRLRKHLGLSRDVELSSFLSRFDGD